MTTNFLAIPTPPNTTNAAIPPPPETSVPVEIVTAPPICKSFPTKLIFVVVKLGVTKYPPILAFIPTFKLPTIPAPPCTRNAPLVAIVDCVELLMYNA